MGTWVPVRRQPRIPVLCYVIVFAIVGGVLTGIYLIPHTKNHFSAAVPQSQAKPPISRRKLPPPEKKPEPPASTVTEIEEPEEEEPDAGEVAAKPVRDLVPTLDEVKVEDVLKIDSKEKRLKFDLLDETTQKHLLAIAANAAGLSNAPPLFSGSVAAMRANMDLFDRVKINKWLIRLADESQVGELIETLGTPPEKQEALKLAYVELDRREQEAVLSIAKTLKASGAASLNREAKEIVRRWPILFRID